jgi:hypothetical protein
VRTKNCKPIIDHQDKLDKYAFTNIALNQESNHLYVADSAGSVFVYDTRKGKLFVVV